ncbi:MAG: DegT/DnrJ/EryC1/StrS family aminotransferase [Kiritimatiellae bacterium]|nr:DegT/DnrJ/EryC1/StrS family aminotransferase [Kiritimatiellia bacterium]
MTSRVKYLDLPKQFNHQSLWAAVREQFKTCQFILGSEVEKFELNFAKLCSTRYALGVNSGTDAIFLALKASGVGRGDEVITVPNSFVATAGAIMAVGARPVFVDVGDDYNIDVSLIEPAITRKTKAILPVHLTGNPANMPGIMRIALKYHLYVIEDAAQAAMASINGKRVGSFGDAGCFSLHPLKNLNVGGDGGVLTTGATSLYRNAKLLRNHGLKNRDEIEFFGYNSRLDSIQATIANYVMKDLETITSKRINNADMYDKGFKDLREFVVPPPRKKGFYQVFHTYVIRVKNREQLIKYLNDNGVETKIHYRIPIHLQKPCRKLGYRKGDFPVTEKQAGEILSLPVHHFLTNNQICYVIELIGDFYQR